MTERYQTGIKNLKTIDGEAGEQVIESLVSIAPDLAKYIIEFAFGDICERQLAVHIHGALNANLSKTEIIEVFMQTIPYVSFPKVLNAVNVAKGIFEQ